MKTIPHLLLPALLAATAHASSIDATAFRHRIDLAIPPSTGGQEDLYAFRLPPALFRDTQEPLNDIRLVDTRGQAIPFEITRRTERASVTQRVEIAMTRTGFDDQSVSNRIEITYTCADGGPAPTAMRIATPLRDFEKEVTVQGRAEGGAWSNLVEGAVIFDASRFMDVARVEVAIPESACREFRVVLHDVTDLRASPVSEIARYQGRAGAGEPEYTDRQTTLRNRDFRIDRIAFFRQEVKESIARARMVAVAATNVTVSTDDARGRTTIRFESGRVPITKVTVQTGSRNFTRAFKLEADAPGRRLDQARPVLAGGTLRRFDFRTLFLEDLAIPIPESRHGAYLLTIENGDNPPLAVEGVALEGPEFQALFMAAPGGPVTLLAGNPNAAAPKYDATVIRMALDRGMPGTLLADAELRANPEWKEAGFSVNKKAALGVAMAFMALVLGAALFKAARRMDAGGGDSASTT